MMQSIQDILIQMAETDPTIQMARTTLANNLPQTLPEELKKVLVKEGLINQFLPYYISVYWPKNHQSQGEALMLDMCDRFGGATCSPGSVGLWISPEQELIRDQILLIKSFTDAQTIVQQLENFLTHVSYLGRVCKQTEVAVEIGTNQSLLLVPGI